MVAATAELVAGFGADAGPVGIGLPAVIKGGHVEMAANLDKSWIGAEAGELFSAAIGRPCVMLNDADAAGVAEIRYGAGKGVKGVVLLLTLGTGIGSALFVDGVLVPNLEFGHIEIRGKDAETRASAGARERRGLSWKKWAPLLDEYLDTIERLVWPDLIILGGGISKKPEKFVPYLDHAGADRPREAPERGRHRRCGRARPGAVHAGAPGPAAGYARVGSDPYPGRICAVTVPMPGSRRAAAAA